MNSDTPPEQLVPPENRPDHGGRDVLSLVAIGMIAVGVVRCAAAVELIVDTTPLFGIVVDDDGNPIQARGYTELGWWLLWTLVWSIGLAAIRWHYSKYRRTQP